MKSSIDTNFLSFSVAFLLTISSAHAGINIDTVHVGDAGNANDSTGFGGVDYDYNIGTHEVTNAQYVSFLNSVAATDTHGLYNQNMDDPEQPWGGIERSGSDGSYTYNTKANFANKPVNYVTFWDAARFTNWLTTGDTENGVYNLNGETNPNNATITRDTTAWNNGGVAVASGDEWYKAAYFSGSASGGDGEGYWLYPTASNEIDAAATATSTGDIANPGINVVNFASAADWNNSDVGNVTTVGSAGSGSASYYGTFDQGGNVTEWNDEITTVARRMLRGGNFRSSLSDLRSSTDYGDLDAWRDGYSIGFRVTSLELVPEPSAYAATLSLLALSLTLIRRRRGVSVTS